MQLITFQGANVLFLTSPHGVGYSYSEANPVDLEYNDEKVYNTKIFHSILLNERCTRS